MRNDHDGPNRLNESLINERLNPAPPPPMPTAKPAPPPPPKPDDGTSKPASGPTILPADSMPATTPSGWEVDADRISSFTNAVEWARGRLSSVQLKVEQIQTASYTPNLGTSPVGQQLTKKFADRLDAPLDDPLYPSVGGLRPMLAEAMRRMDEFIAGAEAAIKAYQEHESAAVNRINSASAPKG